MVTEGLVLGHLVSNRGIEVDKEKIDIIASLPNPTSVLEVRSFLGHAGFYRRFIKNFSKIALPLSKLLQKDMEFKFDQPCIEAFQKLKNRLTSAPTLQAPNKDVSFELMCDASNSALGAVLGQRAGVRTPTHVIAYASRKLDPIQLNYTTTKKELLVIIFVLDKFRAYLLGSKIVVFSDHAALRFLDKKGAENSVADHLSRIEREDDLMPIRDEFLDEQLLHITTHTPWFANMCNFVVASQFPPKASRLQNDAKYYIWDDTTYGDFVMIKCIPDAKINLLLQFCHAAPRRGHHGSTWTARKVLDCGFYWPTIFRDAYQFVSTCKKCQKARVAISRRHEMPQQPILFYEVLDVWGIDFMGPFPVSNGYSYILLVVDYMSRWVEAIANKTNDAKVVIDFLKFNIFCQFGMSKVLISDQGSHFYNRVMSSLLHKYGVVHRIATAYHPRPTTKLKEIKKTLQKMTNPKRKDWSRLLEEAL
ncbi:Retrovirus-related Pol polyprotein, partial [Mucuna pruriens]